MKVPWIICHPMINWSVSKLCIMWNCACLFLHSLTLHQMIRGTMTHQNRNGKLAGMVQIGSDLLPQFTSSHLLSHILCGSRKTDGPWLLFITALQIINLIYRDIGFENYHIFFWYIKICCKLCHFIWVICRDIHIECSKQFKWNLYFYGSGQSGPFWAELKLPQNSSVKFK